MKLETKKAIEKGVICFSPLFTIIMFLLPWFGYVKQSNSLVGEMKELYSFFDLFSVNVTIISSIVLWVSLIGVIASFIAYILSFIIANKSNWFVKIASFVLPISLVILIFTPVFKYSNEILSGVVDYVWFDFMTLPYAFCLLYSIGVLIYLNKSRIK